MEPLGDKWDQKPLTFFAKSFTINAWQGPKCKCDQMLKFELLYIDMLSQPANYVIITYFLIIFWLQSK